MKYDLGDSASPFGYGCRLHARLRTSVVTIRELARGLKLFDGLFGFHRHIYLPSGRMPFDLGEPVFLNKGHMTSCNMLHGGFGGYYRVYADTGHVLGASLNNSLRFSLRVDLEAR